MAVIKRLKKNRSKKRSLRSAFNSSVAAISLAALAIPGLGLETDLSAQQAPAESEVRFLYADYEDYQSSNSDNNGRDRMRIKVPMVYLRSSLTPDTQVEGSYTLDSMSGASPQYLSSLSGASGTGIRDIRRAGDLKVTKYFDRYSLGVAGVVSSEDDYTSRGALIESRYWSEDKNTTYSAGVGFDSDNIYSTNNFLLDEKRLTLNYQVGVTQVLNEVSIAQLNITHSSLDGYQSDPYKFYDNRPESREQWALLARYNRYLKDFDAALHSDFRLYRDTWGVSSQTLEFALYKSILESWQLRPNIRYYSQNRADFFSADLPPTEFDQFISADQRLSSFGSITLGLKISRELPYGVVLDLLASYLMQRESLYLGSSVDQNIENFYARVFGIGISKRF